MTSLKRMRQESPQVAEVLKEWHQVYHMFRVTAYWFVKAAFAFVEEKFEEALELFIVAYTQNSKIPEVPPMVRLFINANDISTYIQNSRKRINKHFLL